MSDIATVLWKELKDVVLQGGRTALLRPAVLLVVFGVVLPLQAKGLWHDLPATIIFPEVWAPVFVSLTIIADAFAGERERHTLESLLATPVGDRSLLIGKMGMGVIYGMAVMVLDLLLGIIVADRAATTGAFAFYPLGLFIAVLAIGLAVNGLGAAAGVLVSLRSSTARQAQQIVTIGALVVLFGGLAAFASLAPHFRWALTEAQVLWLITAAVAVLDAILIGLTIVLFQRARLILA